MKLIRNGIGRVLASHRRGSSAACQIKGNWMLAPNSNFSNVSHFSLTAARAGGRGRRGRGSSVTALWIFLWSESRQLSFETHRSAKIVEECRRRQRHRRRRLIVKWLLAAFDLSFRTHQPPRSCRPPNYFTSSPFSTHLYIQLSWIIIQVAIESHYRGLMQFQVTSFTASLSAPFGPLSLSL